MVSVTDQPPELFEALVGKGRITINFKLNMGALKQCLRIYFEFKQEDETDY